MTNQDQVPEWAVEAAIHQLCVRTNVVYMPSMRLSDYSDSFQGTLLDAAAIIARHAPVIDVKKLAEALFDADNLWIRVWDVDAQRWLAGPNDRSGSPPHDGQSERLKCIELLAAAIKRALEKE